METTRPEGAGDDQVGPESQLVMLERLQDAAEAEAWMPPTPRWHAPLLATGLGGYGLVISGPGEIWAVLGAIVGGVAIVVGFIDQIRRQRAWPRRIRKPFRVLAFYAFICVAVYLTVGAWASIGWPSTWPMQMVTLGAAWLITAMVLTAGIEITNRMRNRWGLSPQ